MSGTTSVANSATDPSQALAQAIFQRIDTDGDGKLSSNEFAQFFEKLMTTLSSGSTTSAANSLASSAKGQVGNYAFLGFDASRAVSAAGSLKYDAYNVLQRYDPADPASMKRAYSELGAIHPGQYDLDPQDNLMLTGTADGYIGARPINRNSDWNDRTQPWAWQWMAYNTAHPGPNGETS